MRITQSGQGIATKRFAGLEILGKNPVYLQVLPKRALQLPQIIIMLSTRRHFVAPLEQFKRRYQFKGSAFDA
jgi:hypothetical protein